ncbi:MAG: serine/threonine-protein kinase [Polyangiaceae bacterium]
MPKPGDIFDDKYCIDGVVGVGGMGVVLAATHLRLDERVAIKFLLPQWAADSALVERFMREGRASAKIRSEHVVRVLDVGLVLDQPYLVLEYLVGQDFQALVEERGPMLIPDAVDRLLQACEALAEAHMGGIIHRDLKPANLFLTHRADGSACVKVLDFGLSKVAAHGHRLSGLKTQATLASAVMGSPTYMAPEQMQSATSADERSDIWSIGVILHELIAGKPPFDAETVTALCACVLRDPPPPLRRVCANVPQALEEIVLRCLEKDPAKRVPDVAELARALAPFGSASSHASAETISRIVDGEGGSKAGTRGASLATLADSSPRHPRPTASAMLSLATPMRSPATGYALAVGAVLLMVGGVGWVLIRQSEDLHAAESRNAPAQLAPAPVATQIPLPPPEVAPAVAAPVPVARVRRASPVREEQPLSTLAVSRAPDIDNPYAAGNDPPASPTASAPASAPSVDEAQLFDGGR